MKHEKFWQDQGIVLAKIAAKHQPEQPQPINQVSSSLHYYLWRRDEQAIGYCLHDQAIDNPLFQGITGALKATAERISGFNQADIPCYVMGKASDQSFPHDSNPVTLPSLSELKQNPQLKGEVWQALKPIRP